MHVSIWTVALGVLAMVTVIVYTAMTRDRKNESYDARLERLEHALQSITLEMHRLAEGQRTPNR
jgi:hypothetical protein